MSQGLDKLMNTAELVRDLSKIAEHKEEEEKKQQEDSGQVGETLYASMQDSTLQETSRNMLRKGEKE